MPSVDINRRRFHFYTLTHSAIFISPSPAVLLWGGSSSDDAATSTASGLCEYNLQYLWYIPVLSISAG